jgi:ABC-2 type transport system permease protein
MQVLWLYVIAASAIWYLPLAAYLLVVSAWAKRAVMLWSILPPIALILVERWFFGTHVIANQLGERFLGIAGLIFRDSGGGSWATTVVDNDTIRTPVSIWGFLSPGAFLSSPETWIGVAAGVALIAAAIQLRRRRSEI